ncbi:hypothetical protein NHQ30_009961 [Ciborinia camelliae]|nr:hypothetical protein NHQ30_009961 [Ciborinia camelliae]
MICAGVDVVMSNWLAWTPWGNPGEDRDRRKRQKRRQKRRHQDTSSGDSSRPTSASASRSRFSSRRTRSSDQSSGELTPAERLARARDEKREREMEEQRVASMNPKDRAAYNESKRLRSERKINEMKVRFSKDIKYIAEQQQAVIEETNRAWKRKHDEDTAAEAEERREYFLYRRLWSDQFPAPKPESERQNIEREANKAHAVELFEKIYGDLQYHFLHPTMINSPTYDPYRESFRDPSLGRSRRFVRLVSNPEEGSGGFGLDSAAVLMLSETFRIALRYGETREGILARGADDVEFPLLNLWEEFEIMLRREHTSIRGFAIARHIPYMMVFRRTGMGRLGGYPRLPDDDLQLSPSIRDPFEVYLSSDGRLLPCLFTPLPSEVEPGQPRVVPLPFQNLKQNIYNKEIFKDYAPPSSWPPSWEYPPSDIQHPCREWGKNYPVCVDCGYRTGPLEPPDVIEATETLGEERICQCKTSHIFDKILVEIREYRSTTTSKQLERGIRSLQRIHQGHIIGEILGEFVPLGAELDFKCPHQFAVDFNGPPAVDESGKVLEMDPNTIKTKRIDTNTDPIATLITGHKGGWTRLLNAGTSQTANVEARSEVWAGRLRITVRALRDIEFGEQLLIRYGDIYLEPDGSQSLNAKKKDHTGRLPMRALSGFYK